MLKVFLAGVVVTLILISLFTFLPLWFPTVAWGTLLIGCLLGVVLLYVALILVLGLGSR